MDDLAWYVQAENDALQLHSGIALKDINEAKSLPNGYASGSAPGHPLYMEKVASGKKIQRPMGSEAWFAGWLGPKGKRLED